MLSSTTANTTILRNYAIAATAVLALSLGVSDLFNNPSRIATQNTIDNYSYYISAGVVSYAQSSLK
ncbi:MAG: hypothetical protein ACRC6M_12725 [Microcystaceae cyanobacterium]